MSQFYFSLQIVARYNMERFSNNLPRVKRLNNFREPISEGYFPKMDSLVSSRAWPSRPENTTLKDIDRQLDQIKYDVDDLERWSDRFVEACHQGFVTNVSLFQHRKFVKFRFKSDLFLADPRSTCTVGRTNWY